MPSATPRAHAASTLPPTYLIFVFEGVASPFVAGIPCFDSSSAKYFSERFTKLETMFFPTNSSGFVIGPFSGTWTCSLHFPKPRSITSSTPVLSVGGVTASCSAT